jgi:membrane protein DedA with SNARE-associated domain
MMYWLNHYIDILLHFIQGRLVLVPLLLLFAEEAGVPIFIPGDIIVAYTGYRLSVTHGSAGFWEALIVAQAAVILGSTILFFLSRRWGQVILDKVGAFIFLRERHIHRAERMFAKYGVLSIIVGRHIPGLRVPITFLAATSGVKYVTFILSTIVSTSLWIAFYLTAGKDVGAALRTHARGYALLTLLVAAAAVIVALSLHLFGLYRRKRR